MSYQVGAAAGETAEPLKLTAMLSWFTASDELESVRALPGSSALRLREEPGAAARPQGATRASACAPGCTEPPSSFPSTVFSVNLFSICFASALDVYLGGQQEPFRRGHHLLKTSDTGPWPLLEGLSLLYSPRQTLSQLAVNQVTRVCV